MTEQLIEAVAQLEPYGLCYRAISELEAAEIIYLEPRNGTAGLPEFTAEDLLRLKGIHLTYQRQIVEALKRMGLRLRKA